MVETPLGNISFLVNGKPFNVHAFALPNQGAHYWVDGRIQCTFDFSQHKDLVTCEAVFSATKPYISGPDSGENLIAMLFEFNDSALEIGFHGDYPDILSKYLGDRLSLTFSKLAALTCIISWSCHPERDTRCMSVNLAVDDHRP